MSAMAFIFNACLIHARLFPSGVFTKSNKLIAWTLSRKGSSFEIFELLVPFCCSSCCFDKIRLQALFAMPHNPFFIFGFRPCNKHANISLHKVSAKGSLDFILPAFSPTAELDKTRFELFFNCCNKIFHCAAFHLITAHLRNFFSLFFVVCKDRNHVRFMHSSHSK